MIDTRNPRSTPGTGSAGGTRGARSTGRAGESGGSLGRLGALSTLDPQLAVGDLLNPAHADRPVTVGNVGGTAVVNKRYRSGAAECFAVMGALWRSPAGERRQPPVIPQPLACSADGVVTMELVRGHPLGRRGDPGDSELRAGEAAALLADLHRSGVVLPRSRHAASVARSVGRKAGEAGPWREPLRQIAQLLALADPCETMLVPSHGDFTPRNLLVTDRGLRLIDLDRMQMASPARDVTYWGAWLWATAAMAGQRGDWGAADRFEAHYLRCHPKAAADLHAGRAFGRAAALVRVVQGWSALRDHPAVPAMVAEARIWARLAVARPVGAQPGGRAR